MGNEVNRSYLPLALGLLAVTLWGQANAAKPKLKTYNDYSGGIFSRSKPKDGEPVGCITGTMGRGVSRGEHVLLTLAFQPADLAGTRKQIASSNWTESLWGQDAEIKENGAARDVFRLCLRPGDYHLTSFVITHGVLVNYPHDSLAIPVKVEQGTTTYIGDFMLMEDGEPHACSGGNTSMRLIYRDLSSQDVPSVSRFVGDNEPVKVQLLDVAGNAPYIFGCPISAS
ncbi:hypothetical protein [Lysobacter tyrosinilyticus]